MSLGKLLLLPNCLSETSSIELSFPTGLAQAVRSIKGLICEDLKEGRRFLRRFLTHDELVAMPLHLLNEHTGPSELTNLLEPMIRQEVWGLISDGGVPCIADPGAPLVWLARQKGVIIETFVGPCSIILALQLSGFSGQQFEFHGYLPKEANELEKKVKELQIKAKGATQIWIEAPYRSAKMLSFLLSTLAPTTRLCVAVDLMSLQQRVVSCCVKDWPSLVIQKEPAIFLISNSP